MNVTWSDSEDDSLVDNEYGVVVLVGLVATDDESESEEPDLEEVMQQYIVFSEASKLLKQTNQNLVAQVDKLTEVISRIEARFQSQFEAGDAVRKSLWKTFNLSNKNIKRDVTR